MTTIAHGQEIATLLVPSEHGLLHHPAHTQVENDGVDGWRGRGRGVVLQRESKRDMPDRSPPPEQLGIRKHTGIKTMPRCTSWGGRGGAAHQGAVQVPGTDGLRHGPQGPRHLQPSDGVHRLQHPGGRQLWARQGKGSPTTGGMAHHEGLGTVALIAFFETRKIWGRMGGSGSPLKSKWPPKPK